MYIYIYIYIICYSAIWLGCPQPTLGHYCGDSLTHPMHPMLITAFCVYVCPRGSLGAS